MDPFVSSINTSALLSIVGTLLPIARWVLRLSIACQETENLLF